MLDSTTEQLAGDAKPDLDLANATWQSSGQGRRGNVQIAFVEGYIAMRDRRDPDVPAVIFSPGEWRAFVLSARDGAFDLT
ncbi:DUF397 domain-containing protein [Streptomyces cinnamoneus]|uniref:DUF397 domain-containing protein n=1 Tax=Streptomyces cinnamoneus TaxID=53446 RepID=A0A2G1XKP6_STRCJ|nr:DUF397 domain-containing protein [Streptomyces cinnamoneus]PHQ51813.1 DUF397 domain-containing protein [Streptomyces cinnamoneus]PPT12059.1 DUF397 domain-containing protein [Streptomyces cinnamoneus]